MHHIKAVITKQNGKKATSQKGFSPNELKEAGINKEQAHKLGIRVDVKRKSTHQANVDCIKSHAKPKS